MVEMNEELLQKPAAVCLYRPSSFDGKCVTVPKEITPVTLTCDMCPPDGRVYIDR